MDYALSLAGLYPYRCAKCTVREFRFRPLRIMLVLTLVIASVGTVAYASRAVGHVRLRSAAASSAAGAAGRVTQAHAYAGKMNLAARQFRNPDIVRLTHAGLSSRVVVKLIDRMPCVFDVRVEAVSLLKNSGVGDDVISAMIDRCSEPGEYPRSGPGRW